MSVTLSAQDIRFRSVWLEQSLLRWELLAPSWKSRQAYLEAHGELSAYEKDWYFQAAYDFLRLQGIVYVPEPSWTRYRKSSYDILALYPGEAWPSPAEAHNHLHRLVSALEEAQRHAATGAALTVSDFHQWVEKALGQRPSFRTDPINGRVPVVPTSEIETALQTLLQEVHAQLHMGTSPIWVAAWAHHALSQIRPYADGNARAAFLLTHYVLRRGGLPGWSIVPHPTLSYYQALHRADAGDIRSWAQLFLDGLQKAVLYALSWGRFTPRTYEESLSTFNRRFADWRTKHDRERSQRIMHNRYTIFDYLEEILRQVAAELDEKLKVEEGRGTRALIAKAYPDSPYYHQFTSNIAEYAKEHGYYFNRGLPRGWFKLKFSLSASKKYQLVFALHHAGHDDATLLISALLHFLEPLKYQQKRLRSRRRPRREKTVYLFAPLPFHSQPLAFSIEQDPPNVRTLLREYVHQSLTQALAELANEIY